jgi:hypothetical protein
VVDLGAGSARDTGAGGTENGTPRPAEVRVAVVLGDATGVRRADQATLQPLAPLMLRA